LVAVCAASVVLSASAEDLLNIDTLYGYGNHVEIPEKTSIRMERLPESVRLVFEFWNEDGVVDPKRLKESMIQEPFGDRTPEMRGAFVPDEWKDARAKDGVLFLQDRRMVYVAAQTSGTDLTLACTKPDGTSFAVKATPEGETSKPFGQPVYAYVNQTADGKTIYRLALPKWLCQEP